VLGTLATVLADLLDALVVVSLAVVAAVAAVLVVKVRRSGLLLIQRGPAWSGIAARAARFIPAPQRRAIEAPREVRPHLTVTQAGIRHV
jgi:hypothetical protein